MRAKRVADIWDESNAIDPSVCVGPATRLQHLVSDLLAARSIPDLRSQEKKKARGAGVGDSLSVCGDDEGREGRRNGPYMLEIRFVDEGEGRVCASRFEAWLLYVPNNLPSVFLI